MFISTVDNEYTIHFNHFMLVSKTTFETIADNLDLAQFAKAYVDYEKQIIDSSIKAIMVYKGDIKVLTKYQAKHLKAIYNAEESINKYNAKVKQYIDSNKPEWAEPYRSTVRAFEILRDSRIKYFVMG